MAEGSSTSFRLYRYEPSMAAAIIFLILFLAISLIHLYQLLRTRAWILIPFVIGGFFQFIGYIGRAKSASESPDWTIPTYTLQAILLLIAPALYAASIYMMLGRIILLTGGEELSIIRKRWLTKVFVLGDVVSFLMQGAGAGVMANRTIKAFHMGEKIIIGGLVVQLVFFGCFIITSATFHVRLRKFPTTTVLSRPITCWETHLHVLYGASLLIFVRSLFRLIEYAQGNDGYLISHEVFLYIFDSVLMLSTMVLMTYIHPSEITALLKAGNGRAVRRVVSVYSLK